MKILSAVWWGCRERQKGVGEVERYCQVVFVQMMTGLIYSGAEYFEQVLNVEDVREANITVVGGMSNIDRGRKGGSESNETGLGFRSGLICCGD